MAVDAYLFIEGIKGESADSNHPVTDLASPIRDQVMHAGSGLHDSFTEREWAAFDKRKFGVGNISKPDGAVNEHSSHRDGLQVDVRAVRKDGLQLPVTWHDPQYDQQATRRLIGIFFSHPLVSKILFNDSRADPRVKAWPHHDNHFHVELR